VCQCWMECSFTCSFSHALSRTCNTQLLLSLYLAISVSLNLSVSLFFSHLTVCSPACSVVKLPTAHPWNSRISIEPSACARKRGWVALVLRYQHKMEDTLHVHNNMYMYQRSNETLQHTEGTVDTYTLGG
jgi:hypothetical protein